MIFKFGDVYYKNTLCVEIFKDVKADPIKFNISNIVNVKNKESLANNEQFKYLNNYLVYKGKEFNNNLYEKYKEVLSDIEQTLFNNNRYYTLPTNITDKILDQLDYEDILHFLKNVERLQPPSNLKEEFDMSIEEDGKGTRIQTYLQSDYLELAAILIICQFILPVLGEYYFNNESKLGKANRNYTLFNLIKGHDIFNKPAIDKLQAWIDVLIRQHTKDDMVYNIRVLESQLPTSEIPVLILGSILIEKLSVYVLGNDNKDKNMINTIYNYIFSKLRSPYGNDGLKDKTMLTDKDSLNGDKESIIESTRITATLNTATPTELIWSIDSIDKIIYQLPPHIRDMIDREKAYIVLDNITKSLSNNIVKPQIIMLGFIFKCIIDSRSLYHVDIKCLLNLIAVAFVYLDKIGFLNLALILAAYYDVNEDEDMEFKMNTTVNISRIPKEVKQELYDLFPYERQINKTKTENLAEAAISNLSSDIYRYRVINTIRFDVLEAISTEQSIRDIDLNNLLMQDIKLIYSEFVIKHEKLLNNSN